MNRKQKDGTIVQIPTAPVVVDYNKNMGGVDLSDQQRQYYAMGRKSRKWWRYLLWFFIDVSIVSAHILESQADNHRLRTQLKFRLELSKMLIGDFSSRSLSCRRKIYLWTLACGYNARAMQTLFETKVLSNFMHGL